MATIVNQSRYLVNVTGRPDLTREFVHAKAAQAQAYKNQAPPPRQRRRSS